MRKRKILIVSNSTWNIYNFRQGLIKQLRSAGYRIVVAAPVDEYIHYINDHYFSRHLPLRYLQAQYRNPLGDLLLLRELSHIYRREKPDLVLHFTIKPNIYGSLAAQRLGIPHVSVVTGLGYTFLHPHQLNRIVPWLYQWAFKRVTKAVFYNNADKELFLEQQLLKPEQAVLIPGSGVNTNHYRPLPGADPERFVFLFIGRLLYDKGIREYVEAARHLKQTTRRVECWIIGELAPKNPSAVDREQLLEWLEEKHVRYFGVAQDVRQYIKQADVVVLPSYREGIPRSILEAMAMGKPIICTDVPGCRETVRPGENGLLVPARDVPALAEAMTAIYHKSEAELEEMGHASRERATQIFDEKIITQQFLQVIQDVLAEKPRRRGSTAVKVH